MATILLTGCAGFIGFHTAQALLERGDTVIGVDNLSPYYDPSLKEARLKELEHERFTFHKCDIAELEELKKAFTEDVDRVCHLAAQAGVRYSLEDPFTYEQSNNAGMLNILHLCKERNVKKLLYASSSSVYGGNTKLPFSEEDRVEKPISMYAATKRYNELLASTYHHLYGIESFGLRFFTVYGPWGRPDMAIFKFTQNILAEKEIEIFNNGEHERDFTYIGDIVAGVVAALDSIAGCELFNLGRGKSVPLMHFVEEIERATGKKAKKQFLPSQPGDVARTAADVTKAATHLNYKPKTDVEEGAGAFVEWYRKFYGV